MSDEVKDAEPVTGEMVRYAPSAVEEYRPRIVMAPEEARALDTALRENMKAVLREDIDYGVIPGTGNKPTLLKPGAEKLLQWFGFGHTMEVTETERIDGIWAGVTYRCTVTKAMPDGRTVVAATCEGYAGYDEDRFYLSAEAATAKERANAERYRRSVNPVKCVEYRAPRNSVVKMSQKRALVGAALQATSASTLFTQDMEDAVPTGPGTPIAEAGGVVMASLTPSVRISLATWYRRQGWPEPGGWSAEQWCAALVEAGRLAGEVAAPAGAAEPAAAAEPQAQRMTATPADDEFYTAPASAAPDTDEAPMQGWINWARQHAAEFTTEASGRTLKLKVTAKRQDGRINGATAHELDQLIDARIEDLARDADVVEGVVVEDLDPADPWADKIADILSAADADMALADLATTEKNGHIADEKAAQIRAAIQAKAATFAEVAA